jgi:hypothetical protein
MKLNSAVEKEETEPFGTILCKNIKFKNRNMRIHAHFCRARHLTPNKYYISTCPVYKV